jgi:spore maturation protein SpmA
MEKMTVTEISRELIEKIKKTVEIIIVPLGAILLIWLGTDYTAYIIATAGVIESILSYIELFLKAKVKKEKAGKGIHL